MPNVSLNNIPLHARPINESLRDIRCETTIQHRFEPNSAPIDRLVSPKRRQHRRREDLHRVGQGRLCESFLLGRVGVVEQMGDDGVEREDSGFRLKIHVC
jgi:hypothetical protein